MEKIEKLRASLAETERCADVALTEARAWLEVWEQAVALRGKLRASLADEERVAAVREAGRVLGQQVGMTKPGPY